MRIQVNGEFREVDEQCSLQDLTRILDLKAERLAIELNGVVVRRADWQEKVLQDEDKVEIVHFVGGGCNGRLHGSKNSEPGAVATGQDEEDKTRRALQSQLSYAGVLPGRYRSRY